MGNEGLSQKLKKIGKGTLIGIAALTMTACSNANDAVEAAHSAGWTNVEVVDSSYFFNFKCGNKEMAYKIVGKNPANQRASATVCCGYTTPWKGCTIRY